MFCIFVFRSDCASSRSCMALSRSTIFFSGLGGSVSWLAFSIFGVPSFHEAKDSESNTTVQMERALRAEHTIFITLLLSCELGLQSKYTTYFVHRAITWGFEKV